jgi:hypothetical protein
VIQKSHAFAPQNAIDIELCLRITRQSAALARLMSNVDAQFKISSARSMPPLRLTAFGGSLGAARRGLCTRFADYDIFHCPKIVDTYDEEDVMEGKLSPTVSKFGFWSGFLASFFSIIYIVGQLAEWMNLLGSGGGAENPSTALGLVVLLTPSLFLGSSFAVLMVSVHYYAPEEKKIWSQVGIVFAAIYTVLISINYYVQLTLVVPHMLRGEVESVRFLLFTPFDSFLYSVDILGYSFMSLSTLFAAFVFTGPGLERTARRFMIANGLILPFVALQNYYHPLLWIAALWAITFPGATISLTMLFKRNT